MAAATLLHLYCLTLNNILSTDKNVVLMQMSPEHLNLVSGVFQRNARGQWNLYQMKSRRAVRWTHILPQEVNNLWEHIVSPINVIKYQLIMDETDELIKLRDYTEMDIANSWAEKIVGKLSDLILQAEQLKIDHGVSARSVRQSK